VAAFVDEPKEFTMTRILWVFAVVAALALSPAVVAQEKMPQSKWDALLSVYQARDSLAKHKEAAATAAELAGEYAADKELQVFCAMTAYYCAHRLLDNEKEKKRVALRGVDCAKRILKQNPKDYDGRFWASMTSFKSKSADGIKAALKEASKIKKYLEQLQKDDPSRFEAHMLLGTLYRELPPMLTWGNPKKGLELLLKAEALAPNDPEVLLELAAAYAKVGDKEKARATYNRCIHESKAPRHRSWETEDAIAYARKMLKELD
jgi:tetratricopeptide (TPR) repeat protein